MKHQNTVGMLFLLGLGGCASLPSSPQERGVSVKQLVDTIQCEVATAYRKNPKIERDLKDFDGKIELEVVVHDETGAGATLAVAPPVTHGLTALNLNADASDTAKRTSKLAFWLHMKELGKHFCLAGLPAGLPELDGSFGLGAWLDDTVSAFDKGDHANLDEINYTLEFSIVRSAGGGLIIKAGVATLGAAATAKRTDGHTLKVALTPPAPTEGPLEIKIVGPVAIAGALSPSRSTRNASSRPSVSPPPAKASPRLTRGAPDIATQDKLNRMIERQAPRLRLERSIY